MIPGDIDLTENLDFRKTRKAQLPAIPWNRKKSYLSYNNHDIEFNGINDISTTTLNSIGGNNIRYNDNLFIDIDEGSLFTTYNTINYVISYYDEDSTEIHIKGRYLSDNNIAKKDIFGNEIIPEKPIKKICWSRFNYKEYIKEIPWRLKYLKREYYPSIPWDTKPHNEFNNHSSNKNKDRICWLSDKPESFIRNYFKEQDNSRYLTDMVHIRISDAIIE